MAEQELMLIPAGMLRISREGEADRVIYPVHADGWRQLGWTVHPPQLELDEGDEVLDSEHHALLQGPPEGHEPLERDPLTLNHRGLAPQGVDLQGLGAEQPAASAGPAATATSELEASFEGMTKAQIIAAVDGRHGVKLDPGMTRSQLIAAALDLEARAAATASATPTASTSAVGGAGGAADHDAAAMAEAPEANGSSAEASGVADDGIDALVPTLL